MKIAVFVGSWPAGTAATGIVTYAGQLVPALRRLGHEVFVLTTHVAKADPHTIDLIRFLPPRTLFRRAMGRLFPEPTHFSGMADGIASAARWLAAEHGVEVLEIEESFGWSMTTIARRCLPVVVRLHGPWFMTGAFNDPGNTHFINGGRSVREGKAIVAAHAVTANCMDTLTRVRDHYGAALADARIIPTPLDAVPPERTWSIDTCDRNALLFVGRFDRLKGADLILRAFERLARKNPRLTLTFVGPDNGILMGDGTTLKYAQWAERHLSADVRARIDFRGRMDHDAVMALRTKHYVTLIAAQFDTFGYMLLEPMSMGCPIVTTSVGGIPEAITDRRNGMLVPSQDDDAMVAACQALLDDPALTARLGRAAWEDCRDKYASETVASQTADAYRQAIAAFRR